MRRFIVAVVWLAGTGAVLAQEPPPQVVLSAAVIDAWLVRGDVPGQSNPSLPATGIGGSAVGGTFGIGVSVSRRVGIDAELSVPAFASDNQEATKYHDRVRSRDTILSGLVRFRLCPGSVLRFEPVAGVSVAFSNVQVSTSYLVFSSTPPYSSYGPFNEYERWLHGQRRFAVSGGIDVPIGRGRLAIVPSLRLHYITREEVLGDQIGLGRWSLRPGIGVHIGF
jgi:hypothetical protein